MGTHEDRLFETNEEYETSTDSQVWEEPEPTPEGDARTPHVADDVPEADALDQARPVPLEDDRSR